MSDLASSFTADAAASLSGGEDPLRLFRLLDARLGLCRLQPDAQQAAFKTVLRGLRHLAPSSKSASEWLEALRPFEKRSAGIEVAGAGAPAPHPLLSPLCDQPSVSFPANVQAQCCAVGARAFLAVALELIDPPAAFCRGLKQLYRNSRRSWEMVRSELAANGDAVFIPEWDKEGTATAEFRSFARRLQQGELPAPRASWLQESPPAPVEISLPQTTTPISARVTPKEAVDNVEPAFDLFAQQVRRSMDADVVDGNRLAIHWSRLHVKESMAVFRILRRDLDARHPTRQSKRPLYAAMRILSFQAGISMRQCFRMPLDGRGDLNLSLTDGCLIRDWSVAAPRFAQPADDLARPKFKAQVPLLPAALDVFRELRAHYPAAATIGEMLQAAGVSLRAMGQSLNADWPTSHRPEDARFAISWRQILLKLGVHPAVIVRITGDVMVTPIVDEFYRSIHDDWIDDALRRFCSLMEMDAPSMPFPRLLRGSPKHIPAEELAALFVELARRVHRARARITSRSHIEHVIAFHNLYATAVALLLQWAHGTRCTKLERQTVQAILASSEYMAISDKKTDLYGAVRIVPKTDVIAAMLNSFVEHMVAISARLKKASHPAAGQFARIACGELPQAPAFLLLESTGSHNNRGYRSVQRKDLVALASQLFESCGMPFEQSDLNRPRHFFYSETVARNLWQGAMDSMLGHHTVGAEPHGFFSGVSVREVAEYLRPQLAKMHADLKVVELVGLGRRAARFLTPPSISTPRQLEPLPSSYLQRKIHDDEELARDYFAREQDAPFTMQTLLAHVRLSEMKRKYTATGVLRAKPAGALYFCLVVYDAIFAQRELKTIFCALRHPPMRVGEHVFVEDRDQGHPVLQRSLARESLLAWRLAREIPQGLPSPEAACTELHEVLNFLDPCWPSRSPDESVRLLCTLAAHWCAVEIAPGSIFCAHHKAPFIPAVHAARILLSRPCVPTVEDETPTLASRVRRGGDFREILEIVRKWANQDAGLGEAQTLRAGCTRELLQLAENRTLDIFDLQLIGQFVADLSEHAPYVRLQVSTLCSRAGKYATVYEYFRRERTFELDPDSVLEAFTAIGGDDLSHSNPPRWVFLHIGPYLARQGYRPCFAPFLKKGQRSNLPPRNPVYITVQEAELASQRLAVRFANAPSTCERARIRAVFERVVPSRRSDVRFARIQDLDERAGLIHFTTSGHAHLKGDSHGSVVVPPNVLNAVTQLKELVMEFQQGKGAALFADSQDQMVYDQFDAVSDALREETIVVTGCPEFRRHDLRAAALTDECLSHAGGVKSMLDAPWRRSVDALLTAEQLEHKYARFHRATAAARHSSGHTALRHYHVGGILDLRRELDRADRRLVVGATYVAAAAQTSRQAVYAEKHRAVIRDHDATGIARLEAARTQILDALPQPGLAERPSESRVVAHGIASSAQLIEGAVLLSLGASMAAASVATGLSHDLLKQTQSRIIGIAAGVRANIAPSSGLRVFRRTEGFNGQSRAHLIRAYARWVDGQREALKTSAAVVVSAVDRKGQALQFHNLEQLIGVIRLLSGLSAVRLRPVISLREPEVRPFGLWSAAQSAGVDIAQESALGRGVACIHFVHLDPWAPAIQSLNGLSARSLGIAGRAAIVGLLAAITL